MSYYYEHRNKDSELNWSYYVTILGTNSWETHRNPPTVWRLIIGCSTLEEAKELEAEAQRRSPDYGYKKITISQQKPAYDYYNDLNVSFVRFDDIMYDWNRARNIEQLRKAIDQESKNLDEINTNDKHKIIVDIEVWRMNDKTYRI